MRRVWKRTATAVSRLLPVHQDCKRLLGAVRSTWQGLGRLPIRNEFSLVLYFPVFPVEARPCRCSCVSRRTATMRKSNDDVWIFRPDARAGRHDPCGGH
jgi:hypothetical protein